VAWFDLVPGVSRRVQDPKGEVALVFDSASIDLALLASRLGPEAAGPVLGEALSTRLSEWASWVGRGAASLSPELARRLLSDLTQGRPRASGRLALIVRKLADRAGDLDAWILAIPDPDRLKPEVGSEIARRLAEAGRAAEARAALDACRTAAPATRFGRGRADPPPPQPESWCAAEIAVLEAEGRAADADEARWSAFERTLSGDTLRTLLAKLPDFEDVIALDRAFEIASNHADPVRGLGFLMNWPAYREAAAMVMARRTQLRGGHDDVPLWAGRLASRFPAAALLLLRARATALVRLGSEFNEEVQGLIGEAEALAAQVSETDVPGHAAFLAELRPPALRRPAWR
ncbi:MAG TPA: hypothetical protein VLJ13_00790, partial [Brevundimonas sp.]|nr:hypothetical protein [Brevundimonas sp.]